MKFLLIAAILVGLVNSKPTWNLQQFIFGGIEVADIAHFPYQLSLRISNAHRCGASIIATFFALSAAHCFPSNVDASLITFRAGSLFHNAGGIIVQAEQYFIHPQFDDWIYDFDVAVIRTLDPFLGENIAPIALVDSGKWFIPGTLGTVAGWGYMENHVVPEVLQKIDLAIWGQQECYDIWGGDITSNMFCAGGELGFDTCQGDSGGAFSQFVDDKEIVQIGIVSFGLTQGCGLHIPGGYTNITHPSVRWFIFDRAGV